MGPRSFDTSGGFDSQKSGFKSGMPSVDQFNPLMVQNSFDDGGVKTAQFNQQFLNQRQFEPATSNFAKTNSKPRRLLMVRKEDLCHNSRS